MKYFKNRRYGMMFENVGHFEGVNYTQKFSFRRVDVVKNQMELE